MRWIVIFCAVFGGCQSTPEQVAIPPLPLGEGGIAFPDLMIRIRSHAATAVECYYRDDWEGVASSARLLELSAEALPRCTDFPPRLKTRLAIESRAMVEEARRVSDAASRGDAKSAGESLSRIQAQIRSLQSGKDS